MSFCYVPSVFLVLFAHLCFLSCYWFLISCLPCVCVLVSVFSPFMSLASCFVLSFIPSVCQPAYCRCQVCVCITFGCFLFLFWRSLTDFVSAVASEGWWSEQSVLSEREGGGTERWGEEGVALHSTSSSLLYLLLDWFLTGVSRAFFLTRELYYNFTSLFRLVLHWLLYARTHTVSPTDYSTQEWCRHKTEQSQINTNVTLIIFLALDKGSLRTDDSHFMGSL